MNVLRLLRNEPMRKRFRTLQAFVELLEIRVEELESKMTAASFPDAEARQRLSRCLGSIITIYMGDATVRGTLLFIMNSALEIRLDSGQHVMVPTSRITTIHF